VLLLPVPDRRSESGAEITVGGAGVKPQRLQTLLQLDAIIGARLSDCSLCMVPTSALSAAADGAVSLGGGPPAGFAGGGGVCAAGGWALIAAMRLRASGA